MGLKQIHYAILMEVNSIFDFKFSRKCDFNGRDNY